MKKQFTKVLIMVSKFTLFGILVQMLCLQLVLAVESNAQQIKSVKETSLNIELHDATIQEVFSQIEAATNFNFNYHRSDLDNHLRINFKSRKNTVADLLLHVSRETGLKFKQVNNIINVNKATYPDSGEEIELEIIIQTRTVSGKVTSFEDDEELPGVNVVEKGTTNGTVTDVQGNFSLTVSENATLVFSSVGYSPEEVEVGNRSVINLEMIQDVQQLQELVVVGYGTQKKSDLTGAISSVEVEEVKKMPVGSVDQALMGRAAGVQVVSNSGEPGGGASIRIRGVGTVNNAEPLYVIDGIPIDNSFNRDQTGMASINPADIESIEILKDASALAIYGARAQNGVVLITTKRGKEGTLDFSLDAWSSVNVLNQNIEMLSGQDWARYYQDLMNSGNLTLPADSQDWLDNINNGTISPQTYNWFDEATRNAVTQNYQLGASGGGEKSTFALSANYFNQEGVLKNNFLRRYSFRLNTDHQVTDKLKFGNTLTFSRIESETNGAGIRERNDARYILNLMEMNPFRPIYSEDGDYADLLDFDASILDHTATHPIWSMNERTRFRTENRLLGSLFAELEIINGLTVKSMFSVDIIGRNINSHNPWNDFAGNAQLEVDRASINKSFNESRVWYIDNTITYNRSFAKHNVTALLGNQAQRGIYEGFNANGVGINDNDFPFFDFTTQDLIDAGDFANRNSWMSFFGRVFYDFDSKYLVTATVRRDGSSRFGRESRYGTFPAASIGWRISEESFMQRVSFIDNLKLRMSYGITGGESAGNYQFVGTVGSGDPYNYVFGEDIIFQGQTLRRLPNQALQWEETKQTNIGIDVGLRDSRINFSIDYFNRVTDNMFLRFTPPLETGTEENPSGNLGKITNNGLELVINTFNTTGALKWNTDFNFTYLNNTVNALADGNAPRFGDFGGEGGGIVNVTRVGGEIGALFGYVTDGVFQTWNEVYDHAYQNQQRDIEAESLHQQETGENIIIYDQATQNGANFTAPGDIRFVDINNDGVINEDDKTTIGSTIPEFMWGMTNTLSYKGFNLSVFFQGVHGIDVFNNLRKNQERMDDPSAVNQRATVNQRWNGEGTSNSFPRLNVNDPNGNGARFSDRWVEDGSFVRLKNIRLSYDLPVAASQAIGLNHVQLYINATNLLTFTRYSGFDPEIGNRDPRFSETAGTDLGNYPLTRQYTVGLRANF